MLAIPKIPHQQLLQNRTFITQDCCRGPWQNPIINRISICFKNHLLDWDLSRQNVRPRKKKAPGTSSNILDVSVERLNDFCIFFSNLSLSRRFLIVEALVNLCKQMPRRRKVKVLRRQAGYLWYTQKSFGDPCGLIDFNAVYSCYSICCMLL